MSIEQEGCRDERTRSWKIGIGNKFEQHRDGWSQKWNIGKLENCANDEETMSQNEERLCKSIVRGLVKRDHKKHTMLADVGQKQEQGVTCFDGIAGKELPWHAVREARELELK